MLSNRISHCKSFLKEEKVDAVIFADPVNLYYYTGGHFSTGILVLTKAKAHLILDFRYLNAWKESTMFTVHPRNTFSFEHIVKKESQVLFDGELITIDELKLFKRFKKKAPVTFKNYSSLGMNLRVTKEKEEVAFMKKAADIAEKAFEFATSSLKVGIEEKQVVDLIELFFLEKYGVKPSFSPIVAFGENSAIPHHFPSKRRLKKNEPVLIDLGCIWNEYCSDTTKIIFFGKVSKKMEELFDLVYEAKEAALSECQAGRPICSLDQAARKVFRKYNMEKYFLHSLGHGVGLDIHEKPILHQKNPGLLKEHAVITIEPGLYLSGVGGVRLEDQVVVTKGKPQFLSKKQQKPLIIS